MFEISFFSPRPLFSLISVLSKILLKMIAETQTGLKNGRGAPVALERWGLWSQYGRWMRWMGRLQSRGPATQERTCRLTRKMNFLNSILEESQELQL